MKKKETMKAMKINKRKTRNRKQNVANVQDRKYVAE
jgi:hypothetical protein